MNTPGLFFSNNALYRTAMAKYGLLKIQLSSGKSGVSTGLTLNMVFIVNPDSYDLQKT